MALLRDLNPVQKEAVTTTEGPLLVLAGAGSGKTRVLTYRIAYLIMRKRVKPWQILAMTFTKKAAGEMKSRVVRLVRKGCNEVWIGTFHSSFARILRRECDRLGYERNFVIYDTEDQLHIIRGVMKDLSLSSQQFSPKAIRAHISLAKNSFLSPKQYAEGVEDYFEEIVSKVYSEYQQRLRKNNAMDFDDLIVMPIELFQSFPLVLDFYQKRFQYLLVDEYQDTNHAQYILVKLLAGKHRNLCVVGDDDQSIYRWRGADIKNILDFEKDYPDCKVFRLEQNYRSTKTILDAASSVVKNNTYRKEKTLWTTKEAGDKVVLMEAVDEKDEALKVVDKIQQEISKNKRNFKEFAVLYRTNAQSRALEDGLRRKGISYVIVGGLRFYERKEIKDILAYLKVISNPRDSVSLRRIINFPSRGIGDVTLGKLEDWALRHNVSLFEALGKVEQVEKLSQHVKAAIVDFYQLICKYVSLKKKICFDELARVLVDDIGILRMYKQEGTVESLDRYQNIQELLSAISDFSQAREEPTLDSFLEEVSLIADIDTWNDKANAVTLMTLHSAKGLEFPVVFVTGLEEGLFPLARSFDNIEDFEEERRLFYVGMTRAKEKLYLSWAMSRHTFSESYVGLRSRFVDEIAPHLLQKEEAKRRPRRRRYQEIQEMPKYEDISQEAQSLCVGSFVRHPMFGRGVVLKVDGKGRDTKVTVFFDGVGEKRLIVRYANLEIL